MVGKSGLERVNQREPWTRDYQGRKAKKEEELRMRNVGFRKKGWGGSKAPILRTEKRIVLAASGAGHVG